MVRPVRSALTTANAARHVKLLCLCGHGKEDSELGYSPPPLVVCLPYAVTSRTKMAALGKSLFHCRDGVRVVGVGGSGQPGVRTSHRRVATCMADSACGVPEAREVFADPRWRAVTEMRDAERPSVNEGTR